MGLDIYLFKVLDKKDDDSLWETYPREAATESLINTFRDKTIVHFKKVFDQQAILKRAGYKLKDLQVVRLVNAGDKSIGVIDIKRKKFYEEKCKHLTTWRKAFKYSKMLDKHSLIFDIKLKETCRQKIFEFHVEEEGYARNGMTVGFYDYYNAKKLFYLTTKKQVLKLQSFVNPDSEYAIENIQEIVDKFKEGTHYIYLSW